MANIKYNKDGALSERSIHLTVMNWIRLHPDLNKYIIHIPNESKRTPRYGKLLKDMGMRKGVSDLFIAIPKKGYNGAWIEIKTMTGKPSPSQIVFHKDMQHQGYYCKFTKGLDDTIASIKDYCF